MIIFLLNFETNIKLNKNLLCKISNVNKQANKKYKTFISYHKHYPKTK